MFDVDPSIGAYGAAQRANMNAASNQRIAESERRIAGKFEAAYDDWRAYAKKLEKEVEDLKLALAVKEAVDEADSVLLAEWRAAHPQSPLRQPVGKLKNGNSLSKGLSIWITKFDLAAKKRGITNPEAHRIS